MQKFDWQAYLDGSMDAETRTQAEQYLTSHPEAQRELDGLKTLIEQSKSEVLGEHVPTDRLNETLRFVARSGTRSTNLRRLTQVGAAAIIAAIAFSFMMPKPTAAREVNLVKSGLVASVHDHDPKHATQQIVSTLGSSAPIVDLDCINAEFDGYDVGHCWMAYKFTLEGQEYTMYGRHEENTFEGVRPKKVGNKEFYEMKDGVGWYCVDHTVFIVKGGTAEGRWKVAEAAAQRTPNRIYATL
ncbi:MAG: hypothetical protein R2688_05760 [Fimbriimonadaceae bacterium]